MWRVLRTVFHETGNTGMTEVRERLSRVYSRVLKEDLTAADESSSRASVKETLMIKVMT